MQCIPPRSPVCLSAAHLPICCPPASLDVGETRSAIVLDESFPTFSFEVWDYDSVSRGTFLGSYLLPPYLYTRKLHHKMGAPLGPSPKYSKADNKHAHGILWLKWTIEEGDIKACAHAIEEVR